MAGNSLQSVILRHVLRAIEMALPVIEFAGWFAGATYLSVHCSLVVLSVVCYAFRAFQLLLAHFMVLCVRIRLSSLSRLC